MVANKIYIMALQLLGFTNSDGTESADCLDLRNRAADLINILIQENLPIDRVLCGEPDKEAVMIASLEDTVSSHETLLYTLYPFGLAALLVNADDAALYKELYAKYSENKKRIVEKLPSVRHGIEDCYIYNG